MTKRCVWCNALVFFDETFPVNGAWLDEKYEDWYCGIAQKNGVSGHRTVPDGSG